MYRIPGKDINLSIEKAINDIDLYFDQKYINNDRDQRLIIPSSSSAYICTIERYFGTGYSFYYLFSSKIGQPHKTYMAFSHTCLYEVIMYAWHKGLI